MSNALSDNDGNGKYKQGLRDKLTAMNGKQMDASTVFIEAFKHIKEIVMTKLNAHADKKGIDVDIKDIYDIQWIVTVPAIWDDTAKDKMITWIEMAGLIDKKIEDHCLLKYEPDCASLSLQYQIIKNKMNQTELKDNNSSVKPVINDIKEDVGLNAPSSVHNFKVFDDNKDNIDYLKGKKYILIDAGGGTVDIACHEFMDNFGVKELFYPTGGPWGDMYVDIAFEHIIQHLLGSLYTKVKKINEEQTIHSISQYYTNKITFSNFISNTFGKQTLQRIHNLSNNVYYDILEKHRENNTDHASIAYMLYGANILENIQNEDQSAYFDMLREFKQKKRCLKNLDDNTIFEIECEEFIDGIKAKLGNIKRNRLQNMIKKYEYQGNKNCFSFTNKTIGIKGVIWKTYLYNPIMKEVIDHVKELLSKDIMEKCSYMYLVGGYSKTQYFQNRINEEFGQNSQYKIDVIIPHSPLLSIVDGAARMGLFKNKKREYVQIRILSKTYGEITNMPYSDINLNDYPKAYVDDERNSYISKRNGGKYLRDCFKIYIKQGDAVTVDQVFKFISFRKHKHANLVCAFYSSTQINPKLSSDGTKLAGCTIEWPSNNDTFQSTTEITFGGEMIKAVSYPTNAPQLRQNVEFKYDWKR